MDAAEEVEVEVADGKGTPAVGTPRREAAEAVGTPRKEVAEAVALMGTPVVDKEMDNL